MMKSLILAFFALSATALSAQMPGPNFVVIMGEAQGWASMSVPLDDREPTGSKSDFIRTPHLDSLALSGIRFSDFYASSSRCTPTRAAFLTGRSPAELHMTFVHEGKAGGTVNPGDKVIAPSFITELPSGMETVASMLKKQGYATAHFGKWHLGRANPRVHGFDENDGANSNGGPENVEEPNPRQCYATAALGMDFMERQVQARKPFYLHLSHYPGKGMGSASTDMVEQVKQRLGTRLDSRRIGMAATNEEMDRAIGLVLAKLKDLGVMENTYVFYTADHGAQGSGVNGALSSGKGSVWEGGLRVPLVVSGPGIKPDQFSHTRASTVDLLPTIADFAGVPPSALPEGLEGVSLAGVIRQEHAGHLNRLREELVIHFPHYDHDEAGPASAILLGDYKMIRIYESGRRHLFDLSKDICEQNDLAASRPEVVEALDARMTTYLTAVNAALPQPNPGYVPGGVRSIDLRGRKRGGR